MSFPDQPQVCPTCGKPVVAGAPHGLCPECLMKSGFDTKSGDASAGGKPAFVPPPVEDIARLFPQLEIIELLGQGGMGAVYKARQPRLNRFVALKILPPEKQKDPQFAERFEREARALAWLNHPNIVTVYDFGEVQGHFYLLMEFVDGLTLRQFFQARRLTPAEALAIVPMICDALQYAHEQGVVHRDIKPENILIDKKGQVKITDFGIAKLLELGPADLSLTGVADVVGTPHYMAPEQIEKPQDVDRRADIYSLGVVFYEMLTGELPLGKFPPPSEKAQVDVRLDEVVLRTLEKEPDRRYQQASEVKTAVETIAHSTALPAAGGGIVQPSGDGDYRLDIGRCVSRGWSLVLESPFSIIFVTLIVLVLKQVLCISVAGIIAVGPLTGGLWLYYLKKIRGEPSGIGVAFSGFSIAFLQLFLVWVVAFVLLVIGFLCLVLPGVYLTIAWIFAPVLVIDQGLAFGAAMKLSRRTVSRHWWKFLGFLIVLSVLNMAGAACFGVGTLLTIPLSLAAMAYAYEDIFRPAQPAVGDSSIAVPPVGVLAERPHSRLGWVFAACAVAVLLLGAAAVLWLKAEANKMAGSIHFPAVVAAITNVAAPAPQAPPPSPPSSPPNNAETTAAPPADEGWMDTLNDDQHFVLDRMNERYRGTFDSRIFDDWTPGERAKLEAQALNALNGPQKEGFYKAICTLAAMHSTYALPAIRDIALRPSGVTGRGRWTATRALGILGDRESVPQLVHLLYHSNAEVRWWAQIVLVQLTGRNFGEDWKAWGNWWNSQNGRPPFQPDIVQWSRNQSSPDVLAAYVADNDHKYLSNLAGTNTPAINDDFWRDLDRRNVQRYRAELDKAPRVLVVRQSHYDIRQLVPTGGNMHYNWLDNRMANLSVTFEDLVSYGYSKDATVDPRLMARTEFPDDWYHGRLTNRFDVISTIRIRSAQRLQAEIRSLLKDQFGLAWHHTNRDADVLVVNVTDPQILETKVSRVFADSFTMSDMAGDWENYFGKPVIDETGATNRYERRIASIPAAYTPGRTLDLDANNQFLAGYGLKLVPSHRRMDWLVLDHVTPGKSASPGDPTKQADDPAGNQ
jgi:tRNA A-37 threonylcarbamoyl transferase component Bud32